jgi:hypothetical protein
MSDNELTACASYIPGLEARGFMAEAQAIRTLIERVETVDSAFILARLDLDTANDTMQDLLARAEKAEGDAKQWEEAHADVSKDCCWNSNRADEAEDQRDALAAALRLLRNTRGIDALSEDEVNSVDAALASVESPAGRQLDQEITPELDCPFCRGNGRRVCGCTYLPEAGKDSANAPR